jgi:hypothetical protein
VNLATVVARAVLADSSYLLSGAARPGDAEIQAILVIVFF